MISFSNDSANSPVEVFQTPSKKRSQKEGKGEERLKKQKVRKEAIENVDVNIENQEPTKEDSSPIYMPSLSSPEPEAPESCVDAPIQIQIVAL